MRVYNNAMSGQIPMDFHYGFLNSNLTEKSFPDMFVEKLNVLIGLSILPENPV